MGMPLAADFTQKEVDPPMGMQCRSGHVSLPTFDRGEGKGPEPVRFFRVSCDGNPEINGTYCEPCLIVAHWKSAQDKKAKEGRTP